MEWIEAKFSLMVDAIKKEDIKKSDGDYPIYQKEIAEAEEKTKKGMPCVISLICNENSCPHTPKFYSYL